MRAMQGSFLGLKLPLPVTDHEFHADFIELAIFLHQVRCCSIGINETQMVYQKVEDKQALLTQDFDQMIFGEIHKQYTISQYYNGWL